MGRQFYQPKLNVVGSIPIARSNFPSEDTRVYTDCVTWVLRQ
jgi:hypothetical protein